MAWFDFLFGKSVKDKGPSEEERIELYFEDYQYRGETYSSFALLVKDLAREFGAKGELETVYAPIFHQVKDVITMVEIVGALEDFWGIDLSLGEAEYETITVVDLAEKCWAAQSPAETNS